MATPYNLEVQHDCTKCTARKERPFCNLADPAVAELDALTYANVQPRGATLFVEDEEPRGVFILCRGSVKLTMSSSNGRTLIVRTAQAGEVLGVSAVMLNRPYEFTAETLEPSQVNFVRRDQFMQFLARHNEAAMRLAMQLSDNCLAAHHDIRSLGLSQTVTEKLSRLLLDWCATKGTQAPNGTRLSVLHTHEEIAQMIGTTRETVTRVLSDFRSRKLIEMKGSTVIVGPRLAEMVTT
jgi:CRP/FNR family transcriptional regulator